MASEVIDRRAGSGRALNYDVDSSGISGSSTRDSDSSTYPLVTALATIASLLLVALLIILAVVVLRKQYLNGPGSLNPLLKSTGIKNSAFESGHVDGGGSTVAHIGRERHYNDSMNNGNRTPMSSLYNNNILRRLEQGGGPIHENGGLSPENTSLSGSLNRLDEPPYERVRTRSEHSYETIRKLSQHPTHHTEEDGETPYYQVEPSYERLAGDKGSLWYETVGNGSVGYETVPGDVNRLKDPMYSCKECIESKSLCANHKNKDPGYEKIKDHEYETLKEKDPGYESLKSKSTESYDSMNKDSLFHGYETVPPKGNHEAPFVNDSSDGSSSVPDILQDIEVQDESNQLKSKSDRTVPPEILALYAQVDKSKKKKKDGQAISPISENSASDSLPERKTSLVLEINSSSLDSSPHSRIIPVESDLSLSSSSVRIDVTSRNHSISSEREPSISSMSTSSLRPTPPPRPKGMAPQPPVDRTSSNPHLSLRHSVSEGNFSRQSSRVSSSEDGTGRPPSVASDCTSPSGTLRPLPPIPKQ